METPGVLLAALAFAIWSLSAAEELVAFSGDACASFWGALFIAVAGVGLVLIAEVEMLLVGLGLGVAATPAPGWRRLLVRCSGFVVDAFGVLVVAGLPATEAGRPSFDDARPIDEGALGIEYLVGILLVGGAITDERLDGEGIVPGTLGRETSLVSSMLIAEAGRDGGPIGLCGAKKLDLRLPVPGVSGSRERLSTVRSDNESRDTLFVPGVVGSST